MTRLLLRPGMRAMMEGWLNAECVKRLTVMAGLARATVETVLKSQVDACVPVVER